MLELDIHKPPTMLSRCGHMLVDDRPLICRYATPILTVGVASLLASLLPWRVDPSHFTLYFLAVMVSAWYGGIGAGLLSTVLAALALDYFFISPIYSIEMDAHALVRLCVFLSVSIITNILTDARRRAEADLRQAHLELEDRVKERTAELAQSNTALREEISERQKLEKELFRLQHEIGRVERLATLGRITGTVAHDLGTPLNSVLGYTQLLAQEELPERARRRLAIIETQIHRMGEIIQNYLAYTRGNPPQEKINLNDLIRDTLLLLQPVFKQRGVQVAAQLAESLAPVIGDGNSIQRVLINLLDNAVDACEEGGSIKVATFEVKGTSQKRPGVIVEFTDTGAGINPEILPKVFDLFVTTKAPGKGTGLGLVICQEIVKAHGGTITIASQRGQGTTVTVFLPSVVEAVAATKNGDLDEQPHIDC
ncbi:MAG TPA: ATP-binding protein [Acidobacteriota bacterium]|nr:ATP-binding protein [Acidobacteriota bacterium]